MTKLIVVAFLALSAVTTAVADDGCSPIGSWYGYDDPPTVPTWLATLAGKSESSGTIVLELSGFDNTLLGAYPTVVGGTFLRGAWNRTSGNTVAVNALAIGRDAAGHAVYIARMYGTDTMIDHCDTVEVKVTVEILDPQTFEPLPPLNFPIPQPTHYGYRITVEE